MTPQQTKLAVAGVVVLMILAGTVALNRSASEEKRAGSALTSEGDVDVRQSRLSLSGGRGGAGGASGGDDADGRSRRSKNGNDSDSTNGSDSDLASIIDATTSQVLPIETEAETRERERYEKAQANKFKYRKLDPEKIKPAELAPVLSDVSEEYGIPDNLLAAMMYVETGGTHRYGDHSMEAGYGVMNLRENNLVDTLGEASMLIGKSKEEVLYNQETNIEGAAALVRSYYEDAIASGLSESEAWYMAVSQYSGRTDPELASHLADETAGWMMKGFEINVSDGGGTVNVPPSSDPPFLPKNWELVGMSPPTAGSGPQVMPGTIPPDAQGYAGTGPAAGGAQVAP